jgi:uncharacterized protein (TIGR02444 family)
VSRFPACALWDFSLAVYARDGVAPACLSLQARRGADVNLLLFCLWVGAEGRGALDARHLAGAQGAVGRWHAEVVRGLRAVRTRLKQGFGFEQGFGPVTPGLATALRKRVGAVELEAEHLEQLILAAQAPPLARAGALPAELAADAARNACAYLAVLGTPPDRQDLDDLLAILAGCFPELERAALAAALAGVPA